MAQQIFKQPSRGRRDDDNPFADDEGWSPRSASDPSSVQSARNASDGAQKTIGNIDDVLRQNEESGGATTASDAGADGSGAKNRDSGSDKHDSSEDLKQKEKNASHNLNYTGGEEEPGKKGKKKKVKVDKNKFWNKKRAGLFGVMGGTVVGGGIFGISLVAQPAQFLQAAGILGRPAHYGQQTSAERTNNLYNRVRAIQGRTFTRTVMAKLGNNTFGHPIDQLSKAGVTVKPGITGQVTKTIFDMDKIKARYPEMAKDLDPDHVKKWSEIFHETPQQYYAENAKAWIATLTQIEPSKFAVDSNGNVTIDQAKLTVGESRLLTKKVTISLLGNGKIVAGIKTRLLYKIFNLPGWLHPFDRARAAAEKAAERVTGTRQEKAAASEAVEEKAIDATIAGPIEEGQPVVDDVRNTDALYGTVGKALTFTAADCEVISIASKIPIINRLRIAAPAAAEVGSLLATAGEIQAGGKGITAKQLGNAFKALKDLKGRGILNNNAPMEMLARGSHTKNAPDINGDIQQAFSSRTTASNIADGANTVLGGAAIAGALCSAPGQIVQGVLSIGIVVAEAIGEVGSAGALTPAIIGTLALKVGTQIAVSAVTLHYLEKFVLSETTQGKLSASLLKGPAGGAILAYGARELANISSTASGGVDMGNTTTTALLDEAIQQDQQKFESQNFFARVFDPYESQSLVGHFMSDVSPSYSDNLINLSQGILHVGSSFSSIFSGLLPKAAADPQEVTTYDWTFGQSGIPPQMMNDPNLQDPYTNADNVANVLDSACLSNGVVDSSCPYITRIAACFGNTVTYTDGTWDVQVTQDADPHSDTYLAANCNDIGTYADNNVSTGSYTNAGKARIIEASVGTQKATITQAAAGSVSETGIWRRMIMFVNDTHTMKAAACFEGDNQSCTDEGLAAGIDATDSDDTSGNTSTSAYDQWISPAAAQANLAAIGITP